MRRITILLLVVCIGFFAFSINAQELAMRTINKTILNQPNGQLVTLSEALSKLAEEYDVYILYDDAIVEGKQVPLLASTDQGFRETLEQEQSFSQSVNPSRPPNR